MAFLHRALPFRSSANHKANRRSSLKTYNVPSPNEMVVDTEDYTDEKEPVAIINPDTPDQESDQLQDLPLADDCRFPSRSPKRSADQPVR